GAGDAVLSLRSRGAWAGRAARQHGVALSEGGFFKFTGRDFALVFDDAWSPRLDQSAADVEVSSGGLSVGVVPKAAPAAPGAPAPGAAPSEPLTLNQFTLGARLTPGQTPHVDFKGSG